MIAKSLRTQPFGFTCNSSPCTLGNSIRILAVVLHYELSFVFPFPPGRFISCPHQKAEAVPSIRTMAHKRGVIKMHLVSWHGKLGVSRDIYQVDRDTELPY